ncbi:MAG: PKD domain-containing protein, partial [Candidatus Helarchaeota archaeon]
MSKNGKTLLATFMISVIIGALSVNILSSNIIPIISSISVDKISADVYEEIEFNVSLSPLSGPINYYIYNFHDSSEPLVTTRSIVNHSFPFEGYYLVTVTAVGIGGITDDKTIEITIENEQPTGQLAFPSTAYEDEDVTLYAIQVSDSDHDLSLLRYHWLFGDGNYMEGNPVNWSWSDAGEYPITLTIFDDQNALYTSTNFIEILNTIPKANFTTDINMVLEDQPIFFNASLSSDSPSDFPSLRYYWDFDDGMVGRGMEIEHIFSKSGVYNVTLLVIDDNGAKSICNKLIIVMNSPPTVEIIDPYIQLFEGDTHTFYANSSDTLSDFQILKYNWSFGGDGWQISHQFLDDGIYPYSVVVSDPEGETAIDSGEVQVNNVAPKVSLTSAQTIGNITIRMTGTPNNTYTIKYIENGALIANYTHPREAGNPNNQ